MHPMILDFNCMNGDDAAAHQRIVPFDIWYANNIVIAPCLMLIASIRSFPVVLNSRTS